MNELVKRTCKSSDFWTGVLAGLAYAVVLTISKSLLLHNSDLRMFLMGGLRSHEARQFLPGATGDFRRSLGISEYPIAQVFDLPWLLAAAVPEQFIQIVFGVTTSLSLYIAVVVLGKCAGTTTTARQIAGFLLPLLMFIPGPVQWNSVALYTASFGWTVSTLTVTLLLLVRAPRIPQKWIIPSGFFAGGAIFWANIHYLPFTLPPLVLALCFALFVRKEHTQRLKILVLGVSMLIPAALVLPLFTGTYFFGSWSISDVAVSENVDRGMEWSDLFRALLPFPNLARFPILSQFIGGAWIQFGAVLLLLPSIRFARRLGQRNLSALGIFSLIVFVIYAMLYFTAIKVTRNEIGLDPHYIEIIAYPAWILLITQFLFRPSSILFTFGRYRVQTLTLIVILTWVSQWVVRNLELLEQRAEYPILLSNTTLELQELTIGDQESGTLSRVIIIQEQFSSERAAEGHRIRRSDNFSETFVAELTDAGVPQLNAYSHMISPYAFALTNELFGDGRPSWRQYSLYDRPNVDAMDSLGIRYVLSEYPIDQSGLTLLSANPFVAFGNDSTDKKAYLYQVETNNKLAPKNLQYSFDNDRLVIRGSADAFTTITVPIEFSYCLSLSDFGRSSDVSFSRSELGLVDLTFSGELNVSIRYENSIFQLKNCRLRDFFYFRKYQQSSS